MPSAAELPDVEKLCREISQLAFFRGGVKAAEKAELSIEGKSVTELEALKKGYEATSHSKEMEVQLSADTQKEDMSRFRI
jgi:hypothetical protein